VDIGLPDYSLRVKDSTGSLDAAMATPAKEKEDNNGDKGNDA
jgi:hypothetical protein